MMERGRANESARFALKQSLVFAPVLLVGWVLASYGGSTSVLLDGLNRISGNSYPISSAVMLLVLAGLASILINLTFYFLSVWKELTTGAKGAPGRRWQFASLGSLILCGVVLVVFFTILGFSIFGQTIVSFKSPAWMRELLAIGRWVTLSLFVIFLAGDLALLQAQCRKWSELRDEFAMSRASHITLRSQANDVSLTRLSIWLIDVPVILLTIAGSALASWLSRPAFAAHRDLQFSGHDDGTRHVVLAAMDSTTFELALDGLEAGILAGTLVISQYVFAVLLWRWRWRALQIAAGRADEVGIS